MNPTLQHKAVDILSRCMDMTIATVRPDGSPQATVVSFVHDGLLVYFGCGAGSQKAANIARDARVSIALTEAYGHWNAIRGLSMTATASEVTDAAETARVGQLMLQRFPQLAAMMPEDAGSLKLFRVTPGMISVLDYSLGFGHTELASVEAGDITASLGSTRHNWLLPVG